MTRAQVHVLLALAVIAGVIAASSIFVVDQTEQSIVLRFGNPVKVYTTPGLKFKAPFPFESVQTFDKRILDVDLPPETVNLAGDDIMPAVDGQDGTTGGSIPIIVDTFARYRIVNPVLFLQRLRSEENAQTRIESTMNSATRDVLGKASLSQLLSPERAVLMQKIRDVVNTDMKDRGVEIVDIRIGRADLTESLRDSTVSRMIAERREEATQARATGTQKAQEIRSTAEKERTILLATAQKNAEITRGEGDKLALTTITAAASQDPDFYAFIKTMFAYQNTLTKPGTTLVLSPDSGFLKYLKSKNANLN